MQKPINVLLVFIAISCTGLLSCNSSSVNNMPLVYSTIIDSCLGEFCPNGYISLSFELEDFNYPKSNPIFPKLDFQEYYNEAEFVNTSLDTSSIAHDQIIWYAKDQVTNRGRDFEFESIHWKNMERFKADYCKGLVLSKPLYNRKTNTAIIRTRRYFEYQYDIRYFLLDFNKKPFVIEELGYDNQRIIQY